METVESRTSVLLAVEAVPIHIEMAVVARWEVVDLCHVMN